MNDLPFVTSAHPRSCALPIATAIFTSRDAHRGLESNGTFRAWSFHVSWLTYAQVRRHAVAILTATGTYGLAFAIYLVVAQFTGAHVWREAVSVFLAGLLAIG